MTRIVLIRHGRTVWNKENRVRGRLNPEMDEIGLKQAEATARYVAARWPVVAVLTSPLRRAVQTAERIARAQGLSAEPFHGLLDADFGEWQGLTLEEVERRYPSSCRTWLNAPHMVHFPGGETLTDVRRRVLAGVDEVIARYAGQSVAMVGHNVVNRVLLCAVLGLGNDHFWRLGQDPCAVNVFDVAEDGTFTLVSLNDTCAQQGNIP